MGGATNTSTSPMGGDRAKGTCIDQKGINKDIAMIIFSKLSVKDLVRFKSVSKHWDHIISDPILSKLYIKSKSTTNHFLFLNLQTREARVSWLSSDPNFRLYKAVTFKDKHVPLPYRIGPNVKILGYVDGLICISGEPGEILLYNPSTRECRMLRLPQGKRPLSSQKSSVDEDLSLLEIVDECSSGREKKLPSSRRALSSMNEDVDKIEITGKTERSSGRGKKSSSRRAKSSVCKDDKEEYEICSKRAQPTSKRPSTVGIGDKKEELVQGRRRVYFLGGIGYDKRTCDYKVVVILFESNKSVENNKVMVFPLRENSWREVRGDFPYSLGCNDTHRLPVNGAIHWFVRDKNQGRIIISFHLSTEEMEEIGLPDHPDYVEISTEAYCRVELGALEGRLAVILHNQYDNERRFYVEVWVMEEYGVRGSWRRVGLRDARSNERELRLEKQISCWDGPMFVCNKGEVWIGDAVSWNGNLRFDKEFDIKDCVATPMGFRNSMILFQATPASPFGQRCL